MIIERLAKGVLALLDEELRVLDFAVGMRYAYAVVEGSAGTAMGVAYVLPEDSRWSSGLREPPSLDSLVEHAFSLDSLERVACLALINAVSQYLMWNRGLFRDTREELDASSLVEQAPGVQRVAVVGYMEPLVRTLVRRGYDVVVLERNPAMRGNALPDTAAPRVLPRADAVLITGSAIANDTADYLLSLAKNAKIRAIVGPSAQAYPSLLFREGFTHVASIRVRNIKAVAPAIRLGHGTRGILAHSVKYVAEHTA